MTNKKKGLIKAGKGALIGDAGEHFVIGELLRRGIVAALAPRNTPGFDVIATVGSRSANIRVKAKTHAANSWVWNTKKDSSIFREISENDFAMLVDLGKAQDDIEYYILRTKVLDQALKRDYEVWIKTPGRGGRAHNPSNPMRRIGYWGQIYPNLLDKSKGQWDLIIDYLQK